MSSPTRPIRVLHAIHQLGDGGADRALTRLVNASNPRKFRHTILTLAAGPGHEPLRSGIRVVSAPAHGGLAMRAAALGGEQFDVVHGWVSYASILAATLAAAAGLPLVLRNPTNMELELQYEPALSETYWPELQRAFRAADAVVVPSPALVPSTRRLCGVEEPTVIPNAVDIDAIPAWHDDRSPRRPFVMASVGRLSPQKDPLTLIDAVGRLSGRLDWRLLMYGQGNLRPACQARAQALGVADRVQFLGFDRGWLDPASGIDAFVSATRYEGMSNALLEAAASGVPIVTTAIPENHAVLTDGVTARLVAPGDARALARGIVDVITDRNAAVARGRAARERMRAFSLIAMVTAHERLYATLAGHAAQTQVA